MKYFKQLRPNFTLKVTLSTYPCFHLFSYNQNLFWHMKDVLIMQKISELA